MPFSNLHHGNAEVRREMNGTRQLLKKESNFDDKTFTMCQIYTKWKGII